MRQYDVTLIVALQIKLCGSLVRASSMFQPCFLAVERTERMTAKSFAPSSERNPPEIF